MIQYKNAILFVLLFFIGSTVSFAQNLKIQLDWNINEEVKADPEIIGFQLLTPFWCSDCKEAISDNFIVPYIDKKIPINSKEVANVRLTNIITKNSANTDLLPYLAEDFKIRQEITIENGNKFLHLLITPVRKSNNSSELLVSCDIQYTTKDVYTPNTRSRNKKDQTYNSVLSSGDFYKISIANDGVYKIDASFLAQTGIDVNSVSMSKFKIYGNGGTMLPEVILDDRPEDLVENAIMAYDQNNNDKLDAGDYFLWYAQGPDAFTFNINNQKYDAASHDFDEHSYYFITFDGANGKRISSNGNGQGQTVDHVISTYDYILFHENDDENHIKSGRIWWGDKMQSQVIKKFTYTLPGLVTNVPSKFRVITGVRSLNSSFITLKVGGISTSPINHGSVSGDYDRDFINGPKMTDRDFTITSETFDIEFEYFKTLNESAAWIDYFMLTCQRKLKVYDEQQIVRINSLNKVGDLKFEIENYTATSRIWNIADINNPQIQQVYTDGAKQSFILPNINSSTLPKFVVFNEAQLFTPTYLEKVKNQNLHGLANIDYVIISHEDLLDQANRLANFHRSYHNYTVEVVTPSQIFNEFSSGSQDVTGIRDFAKLLYDRGNSSGTPFKYLLLFGDASYDYKDIEDNNTNVVPIYQSYNSHQPPYSYCSDDYYAILDDGEGYWGIQDKDEGLDLGVGRLPASNAYEAKVIVDKILHYHSQASFGNWTQNLTFIGDDEDGNDHVGPSEQMTKILRSQNPEYNINKIWLDAYEQVSFGSGNKYPAVNDEITKSINSKGTLIFNYVGHGGENGMAHERVVTRPEISAWTNYDKLSFYITASCELAKIDNLSIESPGELMLLSTQGGAIGMVATTRVVWIGANTDLNLEIMNDNMFKVTDNKLRPLGDIYKQTRNDAIEEINKRCFMLIADPAMSLLHHNYNVVTTAINGKSSLGFSDTLKALDLVTIEGEIRDNSNSLISNFSGTLFPTFYDKFSTYKTLGNDPRSYPIEFEMQDRVIYKGQVSVIDGKFSFQFIVPKDIAYNVGNGKISYYAKSGIDHAGGGENSYLIGGTSNSIKNDKTPPTVELFIDDESWVFGGTTSPNAVLLAKLYDENGLNTIGSGIGREMEAVLDKGTENETLIVLNDYYTPELNSYQAGSIKYPFENLSAGLHTLSIKVWDVYNNSAEDYTEFIVSEGGDIAIDNLLNYPNPFNKFTTFHFDHNKAGENLTTTLTVTTVAGKIVRNITKDIMNAPSHSADISWDGLDEYGDRIARGVYLYTLNIRAEDGSTQKKTEKLYIIN